MEYNIKLTLDELNLCVAGLQKLPYEAVVKLLQNLSTQYNAAVENTDSSTSTETVKDGAKTRGRKKKSDVQDDEFEAD